MSEANIESEVFTIVEQSSRKMRNLLSTSLLELFMAGQKDKAKMLFDFYAPKSVGSWHVEYFIPFQRQQILGKDSFEAIINLLKYVGMDETAIYKPDYKGDTLLMRMVTQETEEIKRWEYDWIIAYLKTLNTEVAHQLLGFTKNRNGSLPYHNVITKLIEIKDLDFAKQLLSSIELPEDVTSLSHLIMHHFFIGTSHLGNKSIMIKIKESLAFLKVNKKLYQAALTFSIRGENVFAHAMRERQVDQSLFDDIVTQIDESVLIQQLLKEQFGSSPKLNGIERLLTQGEVEQASQFVSKIKTIAPEKNIDPYKVIAQISRVSLYPDVRARFQKIIQFFRNNDLLPFELAQHEKGTLELNVCKKQLEGMVSQPLKEIEETDSMINQCSIL